MKKIINTEIISNIDSNIFKSELEGFMILAYFNGHSVDVSFSTAISQDGRIVYSALLIAYSEEVT